MKSRARFAALLLAMGLAATALVSPTLAHAVVGGRAASQNYSFLVHTGTCTGTLIKADWVVTAEHCSTPTSVRVGSTHWAKGGTVVRVNRAINHPSIDVKLLRLASPVKQAPAEIPPSAAKVGTRTRILGWGMTCARPGCEVWPDLAHELDTSVVADSRCSGIKGPYEICTNNPNGNSGACFGDSGGPQIVRVSGAWRLIGVTSRSGNENPDCGSGPSIYGDLPTIRAWINTQVGGLPAVR